MSEQLSMITGFLKKEGIHHAVGASHCSFYLETPGVIRFCAVRITVQDGRAVLTATLPVRTHGLDAAPLMRCLMHINCQLDCCMGRFELEEAAGEIRFRASVTEGDENAVVPQEKIVAMMNYCAEVMGEYGETILREMFEAPQFARGGYRPYYSEDIPRWEPGEDGGFRDEPEYDEHDYEEPDFEEMDEFNDELFKGAGKRRFRKILSLIGLIDEE